MAYQKINFSKSSIALLPAAPAGKKDYFSDEKESGLILVVTPKGLKTFQVYVKSGGKPVRVTLGKFSNSLAESVELPKTCSHNEFISNAPELNVKMARALASLVKLDLKSGYKPSEVRKAKLGELTLQQLFDEYYDRYLVPHKKKSAERIRDDFNRYLGEVKLEPPKKHGKQRTKSKGSVNWSRRRISTITHNEIQKLHVTLGMDIGPRTGNRVIDMLKPMYNRAIEWGLYSGTNPVNGIKKFRVKSRERFLQSDELPRFFQSVAMEENDDVRDYVLISLLTGARTDNVTSMRWADINFETAVWVIPDTKNDDPITVPLMPEALQLLLMRKPSKAGSRKFEFVFSGNGKSKSGHMEYPRKGWIRIFDRDELIQLAKKINEAGGNFVWPIYKQKRGRDHSSNLETMMESLKRARSIAAEMEIDLTNTRLKDLHIHDMRRTLGSWQAAQGSSLVIIGKSLGHRDLASTQVYSRLNLDPVRNSMQMATRAMLVAGGLAQSAEVLPFKKKAGQ